jgi:hypothetical protein
MVRTERVREMIEAVNAAVSSAQMVRAAAEQVSSARSFAANPARIQSAATAPYLSPHVDFNGGMTKPLFIVRDSETGDAVRQFPTEAQIRAYQRAKEAQSRAAAQAAMPEVGGGGDPQREQELMVESSVQFREARKQVKAQDQAPLPGTSGAKGGGTDIQVGGVKADGGRSMVEVQA